MTKNEAIAAAVNAQLHADLKPAPVTGLEIMGAGGYRYGEAQMPTFLFGVKTRLAAGLPRWTFAADTLDIDTCLADTVSQLCGYIASATT